jgi:hypothetical protein
MASGLFWDTGVVDKAGNKIWVHRQTQVAMVQVVPCGKATHTNVDTASGQIELDTDQPFLIAVRPVTDAEWANVTGETHGEGGLETSVTWNQAAGWCEQVKLRLPSHALWVVAREAGLITRRNSGPEFLQDFHWALTDNKTRLPRNPFIAIGDTGYSSPLWVSGSPADLVFNDFLMAQVIEDDFLEVEKRISAFGLNVGVRAEPQVTTWHDRSGNPRQIVERASPFQEGAQPPSDATPPTRPPPTSTGQPSPSPMEDPEFSGDVSPAALLDSDASGLSGGETGLPVFFDDTMSVVRDFALEYQAIPRPPAYHARATISHSKSNGYRIREVQGRRGRPKIRPVWR